MWTGLKCVRFDSIIYSFGPPFYASLVLFQAGVFFFIITGKHPFEMQKVRNKKIIFS